MEPEFAFPPDFSQATRGIVIVKPSAAVLAELQAVKDFFFCRPVDDYLAMPDQEYRALVLRAQEEMDRRTLAQRLAVEHSLLFSQILWCGRITCQMLRLRAARPKREYQVQEVIPFHREGFYNTLGDYMLNVWTPLSNVNASTALQYVPGSHLIPSTDIKAVQKRDPRVTSAGQRIGLLEDIWDIQSGVDLTKAEPMVVLPGEAAIFHGALIHGMGENRSNDIRFSVDFRVYSAYNEEVAKEKLRLQSLRGAA